MLQPIHQQRVLPAQVTQQYLPAITVDTTEVHKLIDKLYNKTIILPPTQTIEVSNYIQTPNGLVQQSSTSPQIVNRSSLMQPVIPQQSIIQPVIPQQSIIQPVIPQPQLNISQSINTSIKPNILFQPVIPQVFRAQPLVNQTLISQPISSSLNASITSSPI